MSSLAIGSVTTVFNTPREFVHYFLEHDELDVPENQTLIIHHISSVVKASDPILLKDGIKRYLAVIDRILSCVAKKISLTCVGKGPVHSVLDESMVIRATVPLKFTAFPGQIEAPIDDFFSIMQVCGISKVQFIANQKLVLLGLQMPPEEYQAWAPPGYKILRGFQGRLLTGTGTMDGIPIISMSSNVCHSFEFVDERFHFLSGGGLARRLERDGELILPPGQDLVIIDKNMSSFADLYDQFFEGVLDKSTFLLNQLLVTTGKTFQIEGAYASSIIGDTLIVSHEGECIIKRSFSYYLIDMETLVRRMIREKRSEIEIDQKLYIFNVDVDKIRSCLEDPATFLSKLGIYIAAHWNPIGFSLDLDFGASVHFSLTQIEGINCLKIKAEGIVRITLDRATPEQLILNLIEHNSSELREGIKEADHRAFILVIFKALLYFTTDDFRVFRREELPVYFKESTVAKIVELIDGDEEFKKELYFILNDTALSSRLDEIESLTPEQFDAFEKETLPTELKVLFGKVMPLVYEELRGGVFITHCVRAVSQYLNTEA